VECFKLCPNPARNAVEGSGLMSVLLEYAHRFQPDKRVWDTAIYKTRQSVKGISPSLHSVPHVLASTPQTLGSWVRFHKARFLVCACVGSGLGESRSSVKGVKVNNGMPLAALDCIAQTKSIV